jgi:hypothetical protein
MSSVNDLNRSINRDSSSGGDVAPNNVPAPSLIKTHFG